MFVDDCLVCLFTALTLFIGRPEGHLVFHFVKSLGTGLTLSNSRKTEWKPKVLVVVVVVEVLNITGRVCSG